MADTAPSRPRWIRRAAIAFGGVLVLAVLVIIIVRMMMATSFGRAFAERRIEALNLSGITIDIGEMEGDVLGRISLRDVTLSDAEGVFAEIDMLDAQWAPLALVSRQLKIKSVEIDSFDVLRRPETTQSDSADDNQSSPIRIYTLDTLSISTLSIFEPVAGQTAIFAVDANAQIGGTAGQARLDLWPTRGTSDYAQIDLQWSQRALLQGSADLLISANGPVARTLGITDGHTYTATLSATGDIDAWQLSGRAAQDDAEILTLSANHAGRQLNAQASVPTRALAVVSPEIEKLGEQISLTLNTRGDTVVANITSDAATLRASAAWPFTTAQLDTSGINVALDVTAPQRLLAEGPVTLDQLEWQGLILRDGETWQMQGPAIAERLSTDQARIAMLRGSLHVRYNDREIDVSGDLQATGIAGLDPRIADRFHAGARLLAEVTYDRETRQINIANAALTATGLSASAAGHMALETSSIDLSGTANARNIGALTQDYVTAGTLEWSLRKTGEVPARLGISNARLAPGTLPFPASDWISESALLNAVIVLADAPIIERLTLNSGAFNATVSGTANTQALDLLGRFNAPAAANDTLSLGEMTGDLTLGGSPQALTFTLNAALSQLLHEQIDATGLSLVARGTRASESVDAEFTLTADAAAGQALHSTGNVALAGENWQVDGLELGWADLSATADLTGSVTNLLAIDGTAHISGMVPLDGLPFTAITADLTATNGELHLDSHLTELALAGFAFETATLIADGTPGALDFKISLDGEGEVRAVRQPAHLELDGIAVQTETGWNISGLMDGLLGSVTLATREDFQLNVGADDMSLNAPLSGLGGQLDIRVHQTTNDRTVRINSSDLMLGPVFELAATPGVSGTATFNLDLVAAPGGSYRGTAGLNIAGLTTENDADISVDAEISADLADTGFQLTADMEGAAGLKVDMTGHADSNTETPLGIAWNTFRVEGNGSGPLETLWAFAAPPGSELKGQFELTTRANPGLALSGVDAQFTVADATFEHGELGLYFSELDVDARFQEGEFVLAALDARGREGGAVHAEGRYGFGDGGQFSGQFDDLVAIRRRGLSATISGDVAYQTGQQESTVTGALELTEGAINLDTLPVQRPPTLDVIFLTPGEDIASPPDPTPTVLDISLTAPRRLNVTGRGVNAELGVDATISGTLVDPKIFGEARIVRGNVSLAGRSFTFTDSTVVIDGDPMAAQLNISAQREADEYTAIVAVTGTVRRPEVNLSANPTLPENEVLSRVLFGRSPSELSALEAAQLAAALASLSGGSGFNLTGGLQESLNLDRVDIGQSAQGGVALTTGKYLAEDVYLELETSGTGQPGVNLEWTPLENVEIGASVDPIDGSEISVQWKRDYD